VLDHLVSYCRKRTADSFISVAYNLNSMSNPDGAVSFWDQIAGEYLQTVDDYEEKLPISRKYGKEQRVHFREELYAFLESFHDQEQVKALAQFHPCGFYVVEDRIAKLVQEARKTHPLLRRIVIT